MLFRDSDPKKENPLVMKQTQSRKLTWKQKFKRDLFRDNLNLVEAARDKKMKDIKEEEEKRAAAKVLSKLFDKKTIYLQDDEQENIQHGHYSAFIPLAQQVRLKDQLQSTFPYIEYLDEKVDEQGHKEAKYNVQNEIGTCLRNAVNTNTVDINWRSCLRKYMCDLDTLKAIEIYIELLKKGTIALESLHKKYGNQCSPLVFFHKVCQSAKYFKESSKIHKNVQSSIEVNDQISEVTLPKTSKYLFCSICLLYDCNHHVIDNTAAQFNFQYIAHTNIPNESMHLANILQLIKFQKQLTTDKQTPQKDSKNSMDMEEEEGQMQGLESENILCCSQNCYMSLNKQSMAKKSVSRRPMISLIHRSLIHMAIDIFSYDPCLIGIWIGKDNVVPGKQPTTQNANRGVSCESIFFYLIEEYDLTLRIRNQLYKSEVDYLINESSRPKNEAKRNIMTPTKKRKNKPKFDHENNQNYRIGCCFHYFLGQQVFDLNCEDCCCKKRGFCLPECQCPQTCQIKKKGCSCKGKEDCRNKKCSCYTANEQCIPGLCSGCFDSQNIKNKKNNCRNSMIQRNQTRYIKIGDSNIYGLGAFAGEDINKDDLVIIYSGEIIEHQIDYLRQGLRLDDTFYNFGATEGGAIDARYIGNKSRFINHGQDGQENLSASTMFSEGKFLTALYAKKNIKKGEELFFDYDLNGEILKNFSVKYPFIKQKKKIASSSS